MTQSGSVSKQDNDHKNFHKMRDLEDLEDLIRALEMVEKLDLDDGRADGGSKTPVVEFGEPDEFCEGTVFKTFVN